MSLSIIEGASLARRAVVDRLSGDPTLMSRVKRVYAYNPPGDPEQPFLVAYPLRAVDDSPLGESEGGVEITLNIHAVWGHYDLEDDVHPLVEIFNRVHQLLDGITIPIPGFDPPTWRWVEMDEEQDADALGFDGRLTFQCLLLKDADGEE